MSKEIWYVLVAIESVHSTHILQNIWAILGERQSADEWEKGIYTGEYFADRFFALISPLAGQ
jgi:hypothetical protein